MDVVGTTPLDDIPVESGPVPVGLLVDELVDDNGPVESKPEVDNGVVEFDHVCEAEPEMGSLELMLLTEGEGVILPPGRDVTLDTGYGAEVLEIGAVVSTGPEVAVSAVPGLEVVTLVGYGAERVLK